MPCQVRHRRRCLMGVKNHAVATRRLLGQALGYAGGEWVRGRQCSRKRAPHPVGGGPFAGLVMDSHGNLFGTPYEGGTFNAGTIFELVNAPEPAAILPLALALLSVALLKRRAR